MIHSIPAEQKYMPAHGGRTLRMRRYNPLPTSVVPLGNSGVLPPPVTISAVDIDASIDFYAQYLVVNEQVFSKKVACYKPKVNTMENLKAA